MSIDEAAGDEDVSFEQLLRAYNDALAMPAGESGMSLAPLYIPRLKLSGPRQKLIDPYVLDRRGRGLLVMVQAYAGMAPDDTLEVLDADGRVLLSAQVAKGWEHAHVSLFIPAEQLQPGPLQLTLAAAGRDSGLRRTSVPVSVVVAPRPLPFALEPPPMPAPLVLQADGGVLDPLLGQVTLQIPSEGVFYGSYVTLSWLLQASTGVLVTGQASWDVSRNMAGRPLTWLLEQVLEPFSGGTLEVSYLVENDDWAQPQVSTTQVVAIAVQPLALPGVPAANNGALEPGALFSGFAVQVAAYPGMRWGDEVELQCTSVPAVGAPLLANRMITQDLVGTALNFQVDADYVRQHMGRSLSLAYTVWHYDGRAPVSGALVVTVPVLQAACLPRLVRELDTLDLDRFEGDLQLIAYPNEWLRVGMQYAIEARGIDATGAALSLALVGPHAITPAQVASGVSVTVPRATLERLLTGSSLSVALRLGATGQAATIECPLLQLRILRSAALAMDTAPRTQTVASSYIILEGRAPLLPEASAKATYLRRPTGGTPPYRYHSNATSVAEVDATGRVRATGNGTATITVTDQKGAQLRYTITFKGVRLAYVRRNLWWSSNMKDAVRQYVESCFNADELSQLWSQYQAEGPVGDVLGVGPLCWTRENILTNDHAWAFELNIADAGNPAKAKVARQGGTQLPGLFFR